MNRGPLGRQAETTQIADIQLSYVHQHAYRLGTFKFGSGWHSEAHRTASHHRPDASRHSGDFSMRCYGVAVMQSTRFFSALLESERLIMDMSTMRKTVKTRSAIMRIRIVLMSIVTVFLLSATGLFAQEHGLAEQFKNALTPQPSQKPEPAPEMRMRAIGGVKSESTPGDVAGTRPSLTMHLEFKFNSDELTPQTVKYLDALGTALQDPVLRGYVYNIEGHTDNVGNDAYNLDLSRRRALAVADYMVKTFGLEREQFEVQGLGKKKPVASNDTDEGRQQNRRVVIVNTLQPFQAAAIERPQITVKVKYKRARDETVLQDGDTLTQRDNYAIEFTPKTSAHVYVYQVDANGKPELLFPNPDFSQAHDTVEPGRLYRIPNFGKWLFLDENKGKEHIVVIAQKDTMKNPDMICRRVMGLQGTALASAKQNRRNEDSGVLTRGVMGKRQDLPAKVETGDPPPGPEPEPSPEPTNPPFVIDMSRVFVWKLSFDHQ
jgi:outer membrane protein OmpA-like peptidoglycan-associated protein